jgi:hypothetical protein
MEEAGSDHELVLELRQSEDESFRLMQTEQERVIRRFKARAAADGIIFARANI